jgi:hypothetical protein
VRFGSGGISSSSSLAGVQVGLGKYRCRIVRWLSKRRGQTTPLTSSWTIFPNDTAMPA